jgi:hypothetical protein
LASFGPGGAIAAIAEKLFRRLFSQGYALGDEHEFRAPEDVQIRKLRQDYVNELFDMKATFEKAIGTHALPKPVKLKSTLNPTEMGFTHDMKDEE